MNINFKVIGLTRLGIKPKSTALEANALTTRLSELLQTHDKAHVTVFFTQGHFDTSFFFFFQSNFSHSPN